MALLQTPRGKLLACCGLLLLLLLAPLAHAAAAGLARSLLPGALLFGLGLWLWRARPGSSLAPFPPALQVTARAGLSAKCAVALVEAGGRRFLIAHGEGFARVLPLSVGRERRCVHAGVPDHVIVVREWLQ